MPAEYDSTSAIYKACKTAFPSFPGATSHAEVILCNNAVPLTGTMSVQAAAVATDPQGFTTTVPCGGAYVQLICTKEGSAGADRFVQECR